MRAVIAIVFCFTLILCFCGPAVLAETPSATPPAAPAPAPQPAVQPRVPSARVACVVTDVDGIRLTEADLKAQIDQRIARIQDRVPSNEIPRFEKNLRPMFIEQFVVKTLLLNAAKKQGITATDDDLNEAITNIRSNLVRGLTLEDVLKQEKVTEKELRGDLALQVVTRKLVQASLGDKPAAPSDKDVQAFYEKAKDRFKMPETVRARHILIGVGPEDDDKTKRTKKEKAESLRKQLLEGADFAKLAQANSDCPSKATGGDLGTFPRGRMVPEFETAVFKQKTSEIGPVVKTDFGYHIIQVTEHNAARTLPLDEVKSDILRELTFREQEKALETLLDNLRKEARITYADPPEEKK